MTRPKVELVVLLFFIIASLGFPVDAMVNSSHIYDILKPHPSLSIQYETQDPIYIYSNEDFSYLAAEENWIGNGTQSAPYIIDGYEIRGSYSQIEIQNTDIHFQIRNCLLTSGDRGIFLYNVENGKIFNNTFDNFEFHAVEVSTSRNIMISNNRVNNVRSWAAITLMDYTENCAITDNFVMNTDGNGIFLSNSFNNYVFNNTAFNNAYVGVRLEGSSDNIISTNTLFNNYENGIWLLNDNHRNEIINNVVFNNTYSGIFLIASDDNLIANNTAYSCEIGIELYSSQNNILSRNSAFNNGWSGFFISNSTNTKIFSNHILNQQEGIFLDNSDRCTIIGNNITDNGYQYGYGVTLSYQSDNNIVKWNSFIGNLQNGNSQALDEGIDNVFIYNYWDEWISPDVDTDGIVDNPYDIDGPAYNRDNYPLTSAIRKTNPVFIDGNVDFHITAIDENWPGDGSKSDPYVINNIFIGGSPSGGLIDIRNTSVHFHINNSILIGGTYGVVFSNVTNGFISNTNISYFDYGIFYQTSRIGTISDNIFFNNYIGVVVYNSSGCTIINNDLYDNFCARIAFVRSSNNTVLNNTLQNDGFYLFGWNIEECLQAEVSGNVVNGKPIIFWQNKNTETVPLDTGQVILINCSNIEIKNLNISESNTGLFAIFSSNLRILNNSFSNNNDEGLWLFNSTQVSIIDNNLINNGYDGIALYFSTQCTLSNNTSNKNSVNGIFLFSSENNKLFNNTIATNGENGINLDNSGFNNLADNFISKSQADGVLMYDSQSNALSGNIITRNHQNSLTLVNCSSSTLSNNVVFNNSGDGLYVLESNQIDVQNNIFGNNSGYGINLEWSNQSTLSDNIFSNCGNIGIHLTESLNSNISNNIVKNNPSQGIYLRNSENSIISHNIVFNNTSYGIFLENSGNSSISNNNVYNILGWWWEFGTGIGFSYSNDCTISSNNVSGNSRSISLWNSMSNILSNNLLSNNKEGMSLFESGDNRLLNNILINEGIIVEGWQMEHFLQAVVSNNTVNGKSLVYWQNREGESVPSGAGQVILVNCARVTVMNQNLSNTSIGLLIYSSSNLDILNNNILNCGRAGIDVISSEQCTIIGNKVSSSEGGGILIRDFRNGITIFANNVSYNREGVWIDGSLNGNISNNIITNNGEFGLKLWNCLSSNLFGNTVSNNDGIGIGLWDSESSNLVDNTLFNNSWAGIGLWNSGSSTLFNNTVRNNLGTGIIIADARRTTVSNNFISNNDLSGIELWNCGSSNLSENVISYNDGYGINLQESCDNINVRLNDFIGNNQGGSSQAFDDGQNNEFLNNYWDDWTEPDMNADDIVDKPYTIDGEANNQDKYPRASASHDTTIRLGANVVIGTILLLITVCALIVLIRKQTIR